MKAVLQIQFAATSDTGRVRGANEDNQGHAEFPWGQVFVVCDGMGGHVGGAKASEIAVSSILEYLARDSAHDPVASLRKAIEFANEQIYATALNQRELKGMGTTCVALLQKETGLWLAHVGDSRAYIYTDGKLYKLSRDHSFVQGLVDQGTIAEEEAELHPRKNELMRALGVTSEVEVEVTQDPIYPKKGDVFVLCSDGLHGMTGDTGIQKVLAGSGSLEEKTQALVQEANEAGGTDNITVHLIHVTDSPHVVNRYLAIKPPVHLGRTLPVEQAIGANAEPKPPFFKRYMIPLVFGGVFVLVVGLFFSGVLGGMGGKSQAELGQAVRDSTRRADSLETVRQNHLRDSVFADSIAKAKEDSVSKATQKDSKPAPKKGK